MKTKNANLFIYLQALGGKFLGPNAFNNDEIKVLFKYSGGTFEIPYSIIATTNDGYISPVFLDGNSSPIPILTASTVAGQNPTVNYLTPNLNTVVALSKAFQLPPENEKATITINVPTPSGKTLTFTQSIWLLPEQIIYKTTMVVPGLLLVQKASNSPDSISVYVKMMCGCKITTGLPTSFWSPSDFMVNAEVVFQSNLVESYSLNFDEQANDSSFLVALQNSEPIKSINFYAQQLSTGNYGALNVEI